MVLHYNQTPLGNITINNGTITIYTNDDAIHADGILTINNGTISVTNSYEGLEGNKVEINNGIISISSKDDGINATTTTGTAIQINGGTNYIYCTGDGLDSNSRTSYQGIIFNGGYTVVISNSNGNSAIDSERGYSYQGGYVVAIMPGGGFGGMGGMTSETTNCQNFSSIATKTTISLNSNSYITITIDNKEIVTIKSLINTSSMIVFLGNNKAQINIINQTNNKLDSNNVCWNMD